MGIGYILKVVPIGLLMCYMEYPMELEMSELYFFTEDRTP